MINIFNSRILLLVGNFLTYLMKRVSDFFSDLGVGGKVNDHEFCLYETLRTENKEMMNQRN